VRASIVVTSLVMFVALAVFATARAQNIEDPIPEPIVASGTTVELVDVVTAPVTSAGGVRPRARLNYLTHAGDGSGRAFLVDMRGRVYTLLDGALAATPFLDVAAARGAAFKDDNPATNSELGVSTLAFHPDFARLGAPGYGLLYTVSTETAASGTPDFAAPGAVTPSHHDVLAEWRVDPDDPGRVDPASRRELLRVAQPHVDHNMNQIAFRPGIAPGHPDYGLLFVGLGDGGNTFNVPTLVECDAYRTAQDVGQPFGKILRIAPLAAGGDAYGVPADNPWTAVPGALPELWAMGLRNPQRFTWDEVSGRMLIADIGQRTCEEVNIGVAGGDYGWSEREGTFVPDRLDQTRRTALPPDDADLGYRYPAAQYDRSEGFAIVGGFVGRGVAPAALVGHYVFGDLNRGRIFHVPMDALEDGARPTPATIGELTLSRSGVARTLLTVIADSRADMRFGRDEAGVLYVLTKRDGVVRRLATTGTPDVTTPTITLTSDAQPLVPDALLVPIELALEVDDDRPGALAVLVTVQVDDGPEAVDDARAEPLFTRPIVDVAGGRITLGLRGAIGAGGPVSFTVRARVIDGAGHRGEASVVVTTTVDAYDVVYASVIDDEGEAVGVVRCHRARATGALGCTTRPGSDELVVFEDLACPAMP